VTHCTVCQLAADHPGVRVDGDGVCSLCRLDVAAELLENARYGQEVFEQFQQASVTGGGYDCLFLYSGGKDSTYMLDRFVNEYGKRVLAYTFNVPFESSHTAENIRLAKERIAADFVADADDAGITRMMGEVFARPTTGRPGRYLDEKLPCVSCRSFFVIRAILLAFRERIPYIALCADPQQILTMQTNVREVVRGFYQTFGQELADELFGGRLEELLFAEDDELPRIVLPFIAMRHEYDPDRIVEALRARGLYASSPMETHCTLFPLLNYYSFKHFGCMFYKLNASSHVRAVRRSPDVPARQTFSIRFPATLDVLSVEQRLRRVTLEIAEGTGERAAQEPVLVEVFEDLGASPEAARFVAGTFFDMPALAAQLGLTL
jgi:hypothetical protein